MGVSGNSVCSAGQMLCRCSGMNKRKRNRALQECAACLGSGCPAVGPIVGSRISDECRDTALVLPTTGREEMLRNVPSLHGMGKTTSNWNKHALEKLQYCGLLIIIGKYLKNCTFQRLTKGLFGGSGLPSV